MAPEGDGRAAAREVDLDALHEAIEFLRPVLQADGGDLVLVEVGGDGVVVVDLLGACGTCPLSIVTLTAGIEALLLRRVPGVSGVVARSPAVSLPET